MFDRPLRGRIHAWLFDRLDGYMHRKYAELKSRLFADLPPDIVEIGAGTGANLRYFRPGTRVIAVEPNRHAHRKLFDRAERHGIDLSVRAGRVETLGLPDASVDAVVASLVLCSVDSPEEAIGEILRVLRPGGRFVCVEHVAALSESATARLQRWVRRPWHWLFGGCRTQPGTEELLVRAGFSSVCFEVFDLKGVFLPVRPHVTVVCVK